ncbi:unnamed protein product [Oppiella nova]|uniref:Uncharacterized protein n=1 Tax=Oppiella nova TaxID=334625 RepID=A0A7R9LDW2_9ACAR|nr:unnamed protein product [Oppiella nova]CAG2161840.1 unnamed protein product [Oppiella nova]
MTANNNSNNNNIIDSKYPKIAIPLVPISRFLIEKLRFHSSKTFLIENETKNTYTFNEVADDSLRMAHVLSTNGLKEGQHFGVCGHNGYELITTLIGGLIVGGVAVPINADTSVDYNLLSQLTISSLPVTGFNWCSTDIVLNTTPLTHINGLIQLFSSLTTGSQFVVIKNNLLTNSAHLCEAIEEWRVSAAMFTPQTIIEMIKDDHLEPITIKSLRKVICTGSSLPKNIGHKFVTKYSIQDFRQSYGMTEMCGFVTIEPIGSSDNETCGIPVPSVSIKIVDTDTDIALGAAQVGEVCVKSPQLFNGYLTTGASNGGLSEELVDAIDSDGWFHTNDIGYYDRNHKLQIVDPIDDFIQYRGLHISPTSLEAILLSHYNVKEVAIFGAFHRTYGQTPTALVVLKKSDDNNNKSLINEDDSDMTEVLKHFINDHLMQQKITVEELYIVDEIPKTISVAVSGETRRLKLFAESICEKQECNVKCVNNGYADGVCKSGETVNFCVCGDCVPQKCTDSCVKDHMKGTCEQKIDGMCVCN